MQFVVTGTDMGPVVESFPQLSVGVVLAGPFIGVYTSWPEAIVAGEDTLWW